MTNEHTLTLTEKEISLVKVLLTTDKFNFEEVSRQRQRQGLKESKIEERLTTLNSIINKTKNVMIDKKQKPKIYTLTDFKAGKISIHVKTQKEYYKLMKRLEKAGFRWIDNKKPTRHNNYRGQYTCIRYKCGYITFDDKKYYLENRYTVIRPHQLNLINNEVFDGVLQGLKEAKVFLDEIHKVVIHSPKKEELKNNKYIDDGFEDFLEEKIKNNKHLGSDANEFVKEELEKDPELDYLFAIENLGNAVLIQKDKDTDKVICMDDENFPLIKAFLEGEKEEKKAVESSYKEGTDIWVLKMLRAGERLRHTSYDSEEWIQFNEGGFLIDETGDFFSLFWHKDGWELYKPSEPVEKKTMTLREAIEQKKKLTTGFDYSKPETDTLRDIIKNLNIQVEIIGIEQ